MTIVIVTVVCVRLLTIAVVTVVIVTYFSKNNLTPRKPMRFLRAAFRDLAMFSSSGQSLLAGGASQLLLSAHVKGFSGFLYA